MPFEDFLARRKAEQDWAFANGFNNGDPATNGEYATVRLLAPLCSHVVDIGAHKGEFSAVALEANPKASLTMVEPNPALQSALLARFPKAWLLGCALSDQPGQGWLKVHAEHPATASLSDRTLMNPSFRQKMKPEPVDVVRLDDQREFEPRDRPLFMKIDAEGFEAKIMRGGERTLMIPPWAVVQFEHSHGWRETGERFRDAYYWLEQRGFDIRRITPYGLEKVRFYTADLEDVQYANYVALRGVALDTVAPEIEVAMRYGATMLAQFPGVGVKPAAPAQPAAQAAPESAEPPVQAAPAAPEQSAPPANPPINPSADPAA
jgi:FkbM family methyltransferase